MSESSRHHRRRLELSLVLDFGPEQYLDANGEIDSDLMRREALDYAADAAQNGEFDVEISLIDEEADSR